MMYGWYMSLSGLCCRWGFKWTWQTDHLISRIQTRDWSSSMMYTRAQSRKLSRTIVWQTSIRWQVYWSWSQMSTMNFLHCLLTTPEILMDQIRWRSSGWMMTMVCHTSTTTTTSTASTKCWITSRRHSSTYITNIIRRIVGTLWWMCGWWRAKICPPRRRW